MPRLLALILIVLLSNGACSSARRRQDDLALRIDASIERGVGFLLARQSTDGAWRSGTYGFMKDGPSLTPHVAWALAQVDHPGGREAVARARGYADSLSTRDLSSHGFIFPAYTAADSVLLLRAGLYSPWTQYLLSHRLRAANGWDPGDLEFGGWGYSMQPPRRHASSRPRGPWEFSNLSATVYALRALHAAGLPPNDPLYADVRLFLTRCQNYPDGDGGFFFCAAEPIRNKAGSFPDDPKRFHSYGSMTADGILAMLLCHARADDPRLLAARRWLESNFSAAGNPGNFAAANEDLRNATYYYYCRSAAEALDRLGVRQLKERVSLDWRKALAEALLSRQNADGSWTNASTDAREDDPLVATPLALLALHVCRR